MSEAIFFVLGAIGGWFTAHMYARRASRELKEVQQTLMAANDTLLAQNDTLLAQNRTFLARLDVLQDLLIKVEKNGSVKLERDSAGAVTGGQVITIDTGSVVLAGQPATLTVSSTQPSAGSTPTIT